MRPISDINVGDIYGRGYPFQIEYVVCNIDKEERMVELQAISSDGSPFQEPFWSKTTNSVFNRRLFKALPATPDLTGGE